jgi:hypothetical protein
MSRGFGKVWIVTGIALIGAMSAGGPQARGNVTTGITISGGFTPTTSDPQYAYIFDVYLNPGSSIKFGDSFTVDNLVGVTLFSLLSADQPEDIPGVIWAPFIHQTSFKYPYSSDVTWAFLGLSPYNNPSTATEPSLIGQFEIVTTVNFKNGPPVAAGTFIDYSYSIDGGHQVSDPNNPPSFTLADLTAPEPSSSTIVLLIGGTAAASGLVARARRRRTVGTA